MTRSSSDEYADLAPLLVEYAATAHEDPRRGARRDRLVSGYLPVAQHIARRYAGRGEPLDDLEQVASMGLMHAVDRFDPGRERDFLSYAVPTITGEIRRYFRDRTWTVRTPRAVKERHVALGRATTTLATELGRAPTIDELAEHLGTGRDEVAEALAAIGSKNPTSLDAPAGTSRIDDETTVADTLIRDDPDLDRAEDRVTVRELVRGLPERERTILVLRFVHDRTQAEIGAELCISQMHVSRLLSRTLGLLRERVGAPADEPEAPAPVTAA